MTLPLPPTPLLSREEALTTARALLNDEGVRLLTLTGPGGGGQDAAGAGPGSSMG